MKVYLVIQDYIEGYEIRKVFKDYTKAEKYKESIGGRLNSVFIEEYDVEE